MDKDKLLVELTVEQFLDYMKCPNNFYIRHIKNIRPHTKKDIYHILKDIREHLMYSVMNGRVSGFKKLEDMYDDLVVENSTKLDADMVSQGRSYIYKMYNWCKDNQLTIADIGTSFELPFPDGNVILKGKFDIIRYNNNQLELLVIDPLRKKPSENRIKTSLEYTIQAYAMKRLVKKYELSGIRIVYLKGSEEYVSYRTKADFLKLELTVKNVAEAIRQHIFYPREGWECDLCPSKIYCGGLYEYDNDY